MLFTYTRVKYLWLTPIFTGASMFKRTINANNITFYIFQFKADNGLLNIEAFLIRLKPPCCISTRSDNPALIIFDVVTLFLGTGMYVYCVLGLNIGTLV